MLTSKISATIAQFKFKANSPKNIKAYEAFAFFETTIMAPVINGTLVSKPKAHINGSAVGKRFNKYCDKYEPIGTPIRPATIVIAPNLNATLRECYQIFYKYYNCLNLIQKN